LDLNDVDARRVLSELQLRNKSTLFATTHTHVLKTALARVRLMVTRILQTVTLKARSKALLFYPKY
jgi:hypothetical protein